LSRFLFCHKFKVLKCKKHRFDKAALLHFVDSQLLFYNSDEPEKVFRIEKNLSKTNNMKRILGIVLFLALGISTTNSQTNKFERLLKQIEETRREAIKKGDFKTLDAIYADDFSAIAGNGQIINKEQLFAVFRRSNPEIIFTTDEIAARVFKKTAIFTGRLTGKTADGKTVSASRFTHFFVKRDGRWQCVYGQSTVLPAT
jgi:ketosteroid isomerase-like protein